MKTQALSSGKNDLKKNADCCFYVRALRVKRIFGMFLGFRAWQDLWMALEE